MQPLNYSRSTVDFGRRINYCNIQMNETKQQSGEMVEPEDDSPIFSSLIKINYDKRFIRIAQDFIENLSILAGATQNESRRISLLIEECLVFIIDKYVDFRTAAHIEICFKARMDRTVAIDIIDIGPPIHESMIPSFEITDEQSEAGLWYKLVRELSDEFTFINLLSAGWLIRIAKKIETIRFNEIGDGTSPADPPAGREQTFGEKHIRLATANDIPAIINLVYSTYRYSYMFKDLYDAEKLKTIINEKLYDIMLIEHGCNVVGAVAFKYPTADGRWAELGTAMVSPEYRSGAAGILIMRMVNAYVQSNSRQCEFFMSSAVTSHVLSQKMLSRVHQGFKPWMIFLNMVPRPDFIGIDHNRGGRESGLYVYHPNQKLKVKRLHITSSVHLPIIHELIANTDNEIEVVAEFSDPEISTSIMSVEQIDSVQLATLSVESLGYDWFTVLRKELFSAVVAGMESVLVLIPASRPLPMEIEQRLMDLNLVFCGLSLQSLERIDLAYCLSTKPVDFSLIKLHSPVARSLLSHIEQLYNGQDGVA